MRGRLFVGGARGPGGPSCATPRRPSLSPPPHSEGGEWVELGYRPRSPQHRPDFGSGGSEKSPAVEREWANRRRAGGPLRLELLHDLPTEALPVHGADAWRSVGRKGGRAIPKGGGGEGPIHLNLSVPSLALPDPPAPEGGRGGGALARRTGRAEEGSELLVRHWAPELRHSEVDVSGEGGCLRKPGLPWADREDLADRCFPGRRRRGAARCPESGSRHAGVAAAPQDVQRGAENLPLTADTDLPSGPRADSC